MSSEEPKGTSLPIQTKDKADGDAEAGPSKSALKKAQKDAEKAAKKAAAKEKEAAQRAQQAAAADEDKAVDNYGSITKAKEAEVTHLKKLTDSHADQEVTIITRIHNSRGQSAKLAFLMLRQQGETIQAVMAAAGDDVSKQMIKWATAIPVNSFVRVTGVVKKPNAAVASATISNLELNVTKIYEISRAMEMLPIQVKDCERPPPESNEEGQSDATGPIVTLKTRLDNRVIDLQTDVNQAIFTISSAVEVLFTDYMVKAGSRKFNTAKFVGAATEGGAGVFEVHNYFGKSAYLAQSPQFYKQMLIAGDCENVFEIGPVFRAGKQQYTSTFDRGMDSLIVQQHMLTSTVHRSRF